MPSSRRRSHSRPSRLPVHFTSYRSSNPLRSASSSALPSPLDRSAILGQIRTSTKNASFGVPPPVSRVTPESLSITLPIPPSVNHQYATVNGRRILSSAGRAYKAQVGRQVWGAVAQSAARTGLLDRLRSGPLALSIRFFFTSALRRDVDGGLKIAQDALCEGLGLNDNRIVETHLYKDLDRSNPRIEVVLTPAAPPAATS